MKQKTILNKSIVALICISLISSMSIAGFDNAFAESDVKDEVAALDDLTTTPAKGAEYEGFIVSIKDGAVDNVSDNDMAEEVPSIQDDKYYLVETTEEAIRLASTSAIEFVEPNYFRYLDGMAYPPNDTFYKEKLQIKYPIEMDKNGDPLYTIEPWNDGEFQIDGPKKVYENMGINTLWENGYDGTGVSVAVLDTGFNSHSDMDFPSKVLFSLDQYNGSVVGSSPGNDDAMHGTLVTSLISAKYNNGSGIAGIAPKSGITSINVFSPDGNDYGATTWQTANAYTYLLQSGNTPDVINMSYGGEYPMEMEEDLLDQLESKGCILIASAGNEGISKTVPTDPSKYQARQYPAGYSSVVAVGALDSDLDITGFSTKSEDTDVSAWGDIVPCLNTDGSKTIAASGTSVASPIVAGIAACLKQIDPSMDKNLFLELIEKTAVDKGPVGRDAGYGYGVIDAEDMMNVLKNGDSLHTVKFNVNGGESISTSSKTYFAGSKLKNLPTVKRTGYGFTGWYTALTGGTKVTENTVVNSDMTLYARWTKIERKVFNPAKNTITAPSTVNVGSAFNVTIRGEDDTKVAVFENEMKYVPLGFEIGKKSGSLQYATSFDPVWENVRTYPKTERVKIYNPGNYIITAEFDEWIFTYEDNYPMWESTSDRIFTKTKNISVRGKVKFSVTKKKGKLKKKKQNQRYVVDGAKVGSLPKVKAKKGYKFTGWYTKKKGGKKITKKTRVKFGGVSPKTYYAHFKKK